MQKQLKALAFSVGALVLLVIAFFAVQSILTKVDETEENATNTLVIWNYSPNTLQSFSLERPENAYTVNRTDGLLTVRGYESFPRDEHAYAHLEEFSSLTAIRKLENADPNELGLTDSTIKLLFTFSDGDSLASQTILLGDTTSDGTQIYIQVNDVIYMASTSQFSSVLEKPTAYISSNLAPYSSNPSKIAFRTAIFTTELGGTFTIGKTDIDNSTSASISSGYVILEPVQKPIAYVKVDELSQAMLVLQGEVISTNPSEEDLSSFGLTSPSGKMTVNYAITEDSKPIDDETLAVGTYTILLGNYLPEERIYYAMVDGTNLVYKVLEEAVPWHDYTMYSIMSTSLLDIPSLQVSQIEVTNLTGSTLFNLSGENPRLASIGENVLDEESFSLYYQLLLRGNGYQFIPHTVLENPVLTITFTFEESAFRAPLTLTFYESEGSNYIVQTSDPAVIMDLTISRAYVEKIIEATDTLSSAEILDSISW